jgi:hypothetical protein
MILQQYNMKQISTLQISSVILTVVSLRVLLSLNKKMGNLGRLSLFTLM